MAFLYLLPDLDGKLFKIGVSVEVEARMIQIGAKFDRARGRVCEIDRDKVFATERKFHEVFAHCRTTASHKCGNTEWFDISAFDSALGLAGAMADHFGIKRIVDLAQYKTDRKRADDAKALLQELAALEQAEAYRQFHLAYGWTHEQWIIRSRIESCLHYPHLLTEVRRRVQRSYYGNDLSWGREYANWLYAVNGYEADQAEITSALAEVMRTESKQTEPYLTNSARYFIQDNQEQQCVLRHYYSADELRAFALKDYSQDVVTWEDDDTSPDPYRTPPWKVAAPNSLGGDLSNPWAIIRRMST